MSRVVLALLVAALLGSAVALSRPAATTPAADPAAPVIQAATAEKNPWTGLTPNAATDQIRFAVVSDRTGGHRAKIFSRAVYQLNLLQPEFVVSVGDLIEGYTKDEEKAKKEWDEFDGYVKKLQMPFFYVPGNHDLANQTLAEMWGGRYGKSYYHFVYKNALFLAVNSEDGKMSQITPAQVAAVKAALAENAGVRWTFVFVHKPLWAQADPKANGWLGVEEALAGRKYTVFCGHVHRYQKFVRNGMNYYQLATTGGGSKLRGLGYAEFDHIAWVTMKADAPVLANVMLDGVLPEDLKLPDTDEKGSPQYELLKNVPLHPVRVKVLLDGKPVPGATVTLHGKPLPTMKERDVADGLTGADGAAVMTTIKDGDGVPAGRYRVAVFRSKKGGYYDGEYTEKSALPAKYAKADTSGLTAEVAKGTAELVIELTEK